MTDSNASRYRAKRRARGDMELSGVWLTREQRCAMVAARLLDRADVDDPEAIADALAFVVAGLAKQFRSEV